MMNLILHVFICFAAVSVISGSKKNVLFLVSDDMRAQLGVYSDVFPYVGPKMHTPNLDALAHQSLVLKRAYVQQAVCSPSRTSLLTGRRPETTNVFDLLHYFREVGGNFTTIPQYFKENGYATVGMGKIFHPGIASDNDDPISWNEPYFHEDNSYWGPISQTSWLAVDKAQSQAHPLPDQQIADHAVNTLQRLAPAALSGDVPFFVAVGFHRPHLPFVVPEEFFDLYPLDSIKLPSNPYAPIDMPEIAWSNFDELRRWSDIQTKYGYGAINTTLPEDVVLNLRRAYYAAISYTDSLVGQVISAMDKLGLSNNTVISFWGDHGWQLGEHGEWCKHTNFEITTHAPMMVRVPGLTDRGIVTNQLTEFVDLYPTLVEAAGLTPLPLCPEQSQTIPTCGEGVSVLPLAKDPQQPWKSAAFSQYPRMTADGNKIMGYSMRTNKYRYAEWVKYPGWPDFKFDWRPYDKHNTMKNAVELYDYESDPAGNINRAFDPAYDKIKKQLQYQLHAGWRKALPPTTI